MQRLTWFIFVVAVSPLQGEIRLLGTGYLSGTTVDQSHLTGHFGNGNARNLFGGISALEYIGRGNQYYALSDRGPNDGAVPFLCRVHKIEITLQPKQAQAVRPRLLDTTILRDESGRPFTGAATAYQPSSNRAERFDPEGMRQAPDGSLFISDEYGPQLIRFTSDGMAQQRLEIPHHFLVTNTQAVPKIENRRNHFGRRANRGMEGLALSPDGTTLVGLMQSPLLQDSSRTSDGKPTGVHCRLLTIDLSTGERHEYMYILENPKHKLNEILAINHREFLVIERDGKEGLQAEFKKIFRIDLTQATEIRAGDSLPIDPVMEGIVPVQKKLFLDLLDPRYGLTGKEMPEKIEGLTFGPVLPNGRKTLIVVSDNDFEQDQPTRFFVFSLVQQDLE